LEEADSYFASGLENSRQFLRQDNIAKAELGLASVHAMREEKTEAIKLALDAREKFVRMGMDYELDQADALLRQLKHSEKQ